jgi:hypothetical protein
VPAITWYAEPWYGIRHASQTTTSEWEIYLVNKVREWIDNLDPLAYARVVQAIDLFPQAGPWPGRVRSDSPFFAGRPAG